MYGLLHLECHSITISNLNFMWLLSTERGKQISISNCNLLGLFVMERGKRDLENQIID